MKPFLVAKTAGLPRWAWLMLLTGGVGIGLYLRSRDSDIEEEMPEEEEGPELFEPESLTEEAAGTNSAGGLQALGVPGPVSGGLTPVQTPYIPEGLTEVIGIQGETVRDLAAGVLETANYSNETASVLAEREPEGSKEIIRERIGGQQRRKPVHKPNRAKIAAEKKRKKEAQRRKQQAKKAKQKKTKKPVKKNQNRRR